MKITKEKLYFHMPVYRLIDNIDAFLSLNLNCEICLNSDFIDNHSTQDLELINSGFGKQGLVKRVHGPFIDLNPGSSDKEIRRVTLERFLGAFRLCTELGSESITLHTHFEPIFYKRHFKEWVKNAQWVWGALDHEAKQSNIAVHIENSIDESPDPVLAILELYPCFGACFDVAHYNVFNPEGWKQALKQYPRGSIKEVHLSDNKGDEDSHLPLGEGSIDLEGFLAEIEGRNEDPVVTIEPHSQDGLIKNLEYIKRFM